APQVRGLARKTKDGPQARRLLALAAIYDGATRTEAAKIGGVGLQIIRGWVLRFNAPGPRSPGWRVDRTAVQAQRHSAAGHRRHDREWPDPGGAWRGALAADRSGAMDLRGIPHHNRQADAQPGAASHGLPQTIGPTASPCASRRRDRGFQKTCPGDKAEIAPKKALDRNTIETGCADEPRTGQKKKTPRRWAKRGTRPSAPRDQRTASTYIFGAVCPKEGKGAALIMPACNTEAMNLHLAVIAATVAPAAHAILLVDQAGWHLSSRLL